MQGEVEKLVEELATAVKNLPSREEALAGLWDGDAVQKIMQRLARLSKGASNWISAAGTLKNSKNFRAAELALNLAIQCNPELSTAWRDLGLVLQAEGDFKNAQKTLAHATTLQPEDPSLEALLSDLQKESTRGVRAWKKKLPISPFFYENRMGTPSKQKSPSILMKRRMGL